MKERKEHESYGMISITQFLLSDNKTFFGSSIKHSSGFRLQNFVQIAVK